MSIYRKFEQWDFMRCADIEIVRARMGPCGLGKHFHDKWSIGLILQGVCQFNSSNQHYEVTESGLFIIPPYEVHECAAASSNVTYQVMYVADALLATAAPSLRRFFSGSSVRVKELPIRLTQLLLRIAEKQDDNLLLNDCFRQLDLFFYHSDVSAIPKSTHSLQDALHLAWSEAVDLKKITEATKYSRWHAIHTFSQQIGLSPRLYLRQLRVLKARYMLQEGRPLAEVANDLHFADQAHFCRTFKSVFGVSPGKLQRVMLGKPPSEDL